MSLASVFATDPLFAQTSTRVCKYPNEFTLVFINYLSRINQLLINHSPPGVNAANGNFRNAMVDDSDLTYLGYAGSNSCYFSSGSIHSDNTASLFRYFNENLRQCFSPDNYKSTGLTNLRLATQVVEQTIPQMVALAKSVVAVVGNYYNPAAWAAVVASINEISDELGRKGFVSSGRHANGWIALKVHEFSISMLGLIDIYQDKLRTGRETENIAILRSISESLSKLSYDNSGHKPWLTGTWQIGFQSVILAGHSAFEELPKI